MSDFRKEKAHPVTIKDIKSHFMLVSDPKLRALMEFTERFPKIFDAVDATDLQVMITQLQEHNWNVDETAYEFTKDDGIPNSEKLEVIFPENTFN